MEFNIHESMSNISLETKKMKDYINELEQQKSWLETKIEGLEEKVSNLEDERNELQGQVEERNNRITTLKYGGI